jgi:hypothetical protein
MNAIKLQSPFFAQFFATAEREREREKMREREKERESVSN